MVKCKYEGTGIWDGRCIGTIGGGCMEAEVLQKALFMIRADACRAQLCHVDLTETDAEEEGMVCGGTLEVLLEVVTTVPRA